jgi:type IV secretory pathway TrbL component
VNKNLLKYACALVVFIWIINTLANKFYWYSAMWYFDIPMHIMGGIFLGLLFGAIFFKKLLILDTRDSLVIILLSVLIVGLGWEFFEYTVQAFLKGSLQIANLPDSIKDMAMDMLGGSLASIFVLKAVKRYNRQHANGK